MSFAAFVSLEEAGDFAAAYEKVASSVPGEHSFSIVYDHGDDVPDGSSGSWLVQIKARGHRTFMELMANLHVEMPPAREEVQIPEEYVTSAVESASDDAVLKLQEDIQNVASDQDSWPGAAIGEGVEEDDSDDDDSEEDDEDDSDDEDDDEDDDFEDEDGDEEEHQADDKRVVKLPKAVTIARTRSSAVTIQG